MWEKYYKWCSSDDFRHLWTSILQSTVGLSGSAIFYQAVTDKIMSDIIKEQFPVDQMSGASNSVNSLDFQEMNALRYTAGYVLRSVTKKISRSADPLKEDLMLCLSDIIDEGKNSDKVIPLCNILDDDEAEEHDSEKWTRLVDRGGLIHVGDITYMLFLSMEMELRKHLTYVTCGISTGMKDKVLQEILKDDDVLYYWDIMSVNWDAPESNKLLKLISEHWITLRGFSFASSFMEKY